MFNASEIKGRMDIVGADGILVGTVDRLDGDRLNLTRPVNGKKADDHRQHFLPSDLIASVTGNKVHLSANGNVATQFEEAKPVPTVSGAMPSTSPTQPLPASPWNWNKIGMSAIGIAAAGAAGAVGVALLNRKPSQDDDFEYRLETDENVRLISSDKVEGTAVIGRNGETLGHIKSFMVDKYTGRVAYAIMTFGGIAGFGTAFFPLPWPLLDYDVAKDGYALDLSREQLADAPRFEANKPVEFTPEFRRKVILFYRS
jgi:hypothetical protein